MPPPQGNDPSPYLAPSSSEAAPMPWSRVVARMVLIVVPGQLVGVALATALILTTDTRQHPGVGWAAYILPGVVAGAGLGLLVRPGRQRLVGYLGVSALIGALVLLVLLALGRARATSTVQAGLETAIPGLLVTVLVETAVAAVLWFRRLRDRV